MIIKFTPKGLKEFKEFWLTVGIISLATLFMVSSFILFLNLMGFNLENDYVILKWTGFVLWCVIVCFLAIRLKRWLQKNIVIKHGS